MEKKIKVLLVEDEVIPAQFLSMELELEGYHVCENVLTGEDAIIAADKENPDVILMDIKLSGPMDGIEAARQIRDKKSIPVIFMTAYSHKEYTDRAKAIDALAYFNKPIRLDEVIAVIEANF